MGLSNYTPSDTFPDLDGGGGQGPLQFPASGDPFTYEVNYIGSGGTANKHGLFGKILNGLYWLKNHMLPLAGGTMTGSLHMAQTTAIVADGTGASISGTWTLVDGIHVAQTKALTADGSGCNLTGTWTITDALHVAQTKAITADGSGCTLAGAWTITANMTASSTSKVSLLGRVIPRSARVPVADSSAAKTLAVVTGAGVDFAGKRFVVVSPDVGANGGSVPRTRTLKSTTAVPDEGETIEVIWNEPTSAGSGAQFAFKTEGGTTIASFVGPTAATGVIHMWAEFEFVGGTWRLGANSGAAYDGSDFGVIPGSGA